MVNMQMIEEADFEIKWECSGCKTLHKDKNNFEKKTKACPMCNESVKNFFSLYADGNPVLGILLVGDECQKEKHHGDCCCNCVHHIEDFHHCTTSWKLRENKGGCVCSVHKGWICNPDEDTAYSGWSEHGMCEMHELKVSNVKVRG